MLTNQAKVSPVTPVKLNPTDRDLSSTRGGPKMKALTSDGVNTVRIKILAINMISSKNQIRTGSGNRNQIPAKSDHPSL